ESLHGGAEVLRTTERGLERLAHTLRRQLEGTDRGGSDADRSRQSRHDADRRSRRGGKLHQRGSRRTRGARERGEPRDRQSDAGDRREEPRERTLTVGVDVDVDAGWVGTSDGIVDLIINLPWIHVHVEVDVASDITEAVGDASGRPLRGLLDVRERRREARLHRLRRVVDALLQLLAELGEVGQDLDERAIEWTGHGDSL